MEDSEFKLVGTRGLVVLILPISKDSLIHFSIFSGQGSTEVCLFCHHGHVGDILEAGKFFRLHFDGRKLHRKFGKDWLKSFENRPIETENRSEKFENRSEKFENDHEEMKNGQLKVPSQPKDEARPDCCSGQQDLFEHEPKNTSDEESEEVSMS